MRFSRRIGRPQHLQAQKPHCAAERRRLLCDPGIKKVSTCIWWPASQRRRRYIDSEEKKQREWPALNSHGWRCQTRVLRANPGIRIDDGSANTHSSGSECYNGRRAPWRTWVCNRVNVPGERIAYFRLASYFSALLEIYRYFLTDSPLGYELYALKCFKYW